LEQTSNQFWLRMLGSLVFVCLLILGTWKWLGPRFAQRQAQSGNPSPGSAGAGFLPHRAFTTSLQQVLGQPPSETTEPTDAFKVISSKVLTRHVELFLVEIKDRQLVLSVSPQGTQVLTVFAPPPVPFPMHEELSTALEEPSAPVELPPPLRRISAARQNALGTSAEREPSLPKKPSPIPKAQQELAQSQMANDYPTEHYLIDELFEASPVKAKSKANARNGRLPDVSRPVNSVGITPPVLNRMPTLTPDDVVVLDDYEDHYLS
jgi:flagellar biogenesis protein FliO